NSTSIFNGREGVVGKNDAQFFFALGDILLNGQNIEFKQIPDTVKINSVELLNEYLETEPFTVNESTNLTYGVQYGITDSALCTDALDSSKIISFKVELVDNQTGEILSTVDKIDYSSNNISQYDNLGYQFDLSGFDKRTLKLRLSVNASDDFNCSLSERFSDQSQLAKSNYQVKEINSNISKVTNYALFNNYPNPFNPSTTIKYQLPQDGLVTLKIYDILGKEITTLINEEKPAGKYEVNFNASQLASGVYIYKIQAGDFVNSRKMVLLK
ncbi:MAG: T9SS type A sorting domain-containing protein, partial [Ignavibacteriaceae bacterium]